MTLFFLLLDTLNCSLTEPPQNYRDAPAWFLGLAIPVILWWFGERTVKGIKEKKE